MLKWRSILCLDQIEQIQSDNVETWIFWLMEKQWIKSVAQMQINHLHFLEYTSIKLSHGDIHGAQTDVGNWEGGLKPCLPLSGRVWIHPRQLYTGPGSRTSTSGLRLGGWLRTTRAPPHVTTWRPSLETARGNCPGVNFAQLWGFHLNPQLHRPF